MVELCSMASHGYPPGVGVGFHSELGASRLPDDFHHFIPCHGSNQYLVNPLSFNLSLQQKEEWRSTSVILDSSHVVGIDSRHKQPAIIDFQDIRPHSVLFSYRIVELCVRHEKILKLLASGSIGEADPLLDLSMLYYLMGPQSPIADLPQQPFASCSRWYFGDAQTLQDLIYPTRELHFKKPFLDLLWDWSSCSEKAYLPDGQVLYNHTGTEINDILSVISYLHSSKNTNKSIGQTMLVPYFERRRRRRTADSDALKLATEKVRSLSHEKSKEKISQKKKKHGVRTGKEKAIYCNSYLHACESLLSIMVDRKHHSKNAIHLLKKSGPQLPQLLTKISASIAGTGIAVIFSVLCSLSCSRAPFCVSKLLSTGLGLGLVWLSWAVNRLRNTVISIVKTSGKPSEKEEEMMNHFDRNLKDIYFRAAALIAVVVLKVA